MLAALLAVTIGATASVAAAPRPAACDLSLPATCSDTNTLVWTPSFRAAVRRFVGRRRATYLDGSAPVADQMLDVLGGPPDDPARIGRLYRFTACRAHSCQEKGAVVLQPDGAILALAILHSACAAAHASNDCFAHDTLTIYIRAPADAAVVADLTGWARSQIAAGYTPAGLPPEHLDAVETVPVQAAPVRRTTPR